jgi:hypothetical protein
MPAEHLPSPTSRNYRPYRQHRFTYCLRGVVPLAPPGDESSETLLEEQAAQMGAHAEIKEHEDPTTGEMVTNISIGFLAIEGTLTAEEAHGTATVLVHDWLEEKEAENVELDEVLFVSGQGSVEGEVPLEITPSSEAVMKMMETFEVPLPEEFSATG